MICVYFLLLSRPGAMIASGENSFPRWNPSPEAIVVYEGRRTRDGELSGQSQCASRSCDVWLFYWLCLRSTRRRREMDSNHLSRDKWERCSEARPIVRSPG